MIKYRPSNGTEGEWFHSNFCDQCLHDREYREKQENGCELICFAMAFDTKDPEYPKEWIEDENGPRCTKFELDTPEAEQRKRWKQRRDKNTPDLFGA